MFEYRLSRYGGGWYWEVFEVDDEKQVPGMAPKIGTSVTGWAFTRGSAFRQMKRYKKGKLRERATKERGFL